MTPTNTTTLTPPVREQVVKFSRYLGRIVFEIDKQPHNNRTDALTYTIEKVDVLARVTVTPPLGSRLPTIIENVERVSITLETPVGHRTTRDAIAFAGKLTDRATAMARLGKLIAHAEAIENESLLVRWQGFKQQIEQSADALFC